MRMSFGLCNAPATFQRCMTAIFSDMIEDIIEVFMDDFLVFGRSFDGSLHNLKLVLKLLCDITSHMTVTSYGHMIIYHTEEHKRF